MKKILLIGLAALSFNAFSQSYVVLTNGVLLTTDKKGFVYDLVQYVNPYRVSVNGGSFLIEDERLSTISSDGYYYEKKVKIKKIRGKGLNYLIDNDRNLITIAADGTFVKYEESNKELKRVDRFGGNFFLAPDKKKTNVDLYTVDSKGGYFKANVTGLNPADINVIGGTYFMAKGVLYTVNKDGFVADKPMFRIPAIKKMGGNYFIDSNDKIWTISDEGIVSNPVIPANLDIQEIEKLGSNYMIDRFGAMFTVDDKGNIHSRDVNLHDLTNAKILSH